MPPTALATIAIAKFLLNPNTTQLTIDPPNPFNKLIIIIIKIMI